MEQTVRDSSSRSAPIPAARAVATLLAFAAAVTAFGLLTGSPEPRPASAAQPEAAPIASAAQDAPSAAADDDGNVFIYH